MKHTKPYDQQILEGWETAHKKGQLTFLILLALRDSPKHMASVKDFIMQATNDMFAVDDKSMYRALRRLSEIEMIDFIQEPGDGGPDRKVYDLTDVGNTVLNQFIERNITNLYYKPHIKKLLERKSDGI